MGSIMASALVDVIVEKLFVMMNKEASLILNFRKEFEWLRNKLTSTKRCLREADLQSAHNESMKNWLLNFADIALDAEDILDECAVEFEGTNNESSQSSCICAFNYSQLVFRYKMPRRIRDVKDRMSSIMGDAAELKLFADLTHSDQPSTSKSQNMKGRKGSVIERDSRPVAIESKVQDVIRLLDDPAVPVIAVVGMGGVGKTFLMQNVFERRKNSFQKSIWLSISQTYSRQKLQAALALQLVMSDDELQAAQLKEVVKGRVNELQAQLKVVAKGSADEVSAADLIHKRLTSTHASFLIVLDDVWRATGEDNLISALGLPAGHNSHCKIVVTTRSRHVCRNMNARVYELQVLSEEESWNLFCAFAFQNQPPEKLEGIARQVEGQCGRLPLAVKTVAASLADTRLSREWESKLELLRSVVSYTEDPIMKILKLSYDSLPSHLKPCFAFLSFFPEDEEIDSQYLINLWVAEGYIPRGEDQLDIGWDYICHLQSLCLVERVGDIYEQRYVEGNSTFGFGDDGARRFKLHDLLLDLAISIAKESQCAFRVEEVFKEGSIVQTVSRYRRILMGKKSIGDSDVDKMASNRAYSASRLRTLSFSQNKGIRNVPASLLSCARLLHILDLSGTGISSLPACVGNLKFLQVLNLRDTGIAEVPECVKGNKSLRLLDISMCPNLGQLPEWIGDLNCLEHLSIRPTRYNYHLRLLPEGISKLVSLQVLELNLLNRLSIGDNKFLKLEYFANLVNIREVCITIGEEAESKSIKDGILATLVNLTIWSHVGGNLPSLSEKMLAMKDLEYLFLGQFAVPTWLNRFSNLMQLKLWECHCAEYPALEMMINLIKLELIFNNNCKALPQGFGNSRGFPQLRHFTISQFRVLEELSELEDGAMPNLEILHVSLCPKLKKGQREWELLKSLKKCRFLLESNLD